MPYLSREDIDRFAERIIHLYKQTEYPKGHLYYNVDPTRLAEIYEFRIEYSIVMFMILGAISVLSHIYNLNNIKSKTVGDGQHGTARWARDEEIKSTYKHIPFTPKEWRAGKNLPKADAQGIVVGCKSSKGGTTAMVDTGDVHALMIGAAGVGKTAYFLYPNLEYACASGMSFITSDTKGDLYRHYGKIAKEYYCVRWLCSKQ